MNKRALAVQFALVLGAVFFGSEPQAGEEETGIWFEFAEVHEQSGKTIYYVEFAEDSEDDLGFLTLVYVTIGCGPTVENARSVFSELRFGFVAKDGEYAGSWQTDSGAGEAGKDLWYVSSEHPYVLSSYGGPTQEKMLHALLKAETFSVEFENGRASNIPAFKIMLPRENTLVSEFLSKCL